MPPRATPIDEFYSNLDGFDSWVYKKFPKHIGYLHFSGTNVGEDPASTPTSYPAGLGTYIPVKDSAGSLFPSLSRDRSGTTVVDPRGKSISFEFFLHIPSQSCDTQTIFQKLSKNGTHGISLFLSSSLTGSGNNESANLVFAVTSGSSAMVVSGSILKGGFRHVTAVWDRKINYNQQHFLSSMLHQQSSCNA